MDIQAAYQINWKIIIIQLNSNILFCILLKGPKLEMSTYKIKY